MEDKAVDAGLPSSIVYIQSDKLPVPRLAAGSKPHSVRLGDTWIGPYGKGRWEG